MLQCHHLSCSSLHCRSQWDHPTKRWLFIHHLPPFPLLTPILLLLPSPPVLPPSPYPCPGTIFGIYKVPASASGPSSPLSQEQASAAVMQPGRELVAAGYALFSSATALVLSVGHGTHGFTLDPLTGEFVHTQPLLAVPKRGQWTVRRCRELVMWQRCSPPACVGLAHGV